MTKDEENNIDWRLTTFEGVRLEQLRRWSMLSLEQILTAQEEMDALARLFQNSNQPPPATD